MSNMGQFGSRRSLVSPVMPTGEVVATYATYAEAQAAVDVLAKADFPVRQLSIVGNDLKTVERVTGKLSYGRVALGGAASGAWLGIFFGLLFFIFSPTGSSLPFVFAAVLIGAGFGMLFGLVSYALNRRRRDFTSTMQVIATNYQVIVENALVNRARNVLAGQGEASSETAAVPHPSDPPRAFVAPSHQQGAYGESAEPDADADTGAAPSGTDEAGNDPSGATPSGTDAGTDTETDAGTGTGTDAGASGTSPSGTTPAGPSAPGASS
ncbi:hypothetical protein GCM10022381_14290 [Leifsonia kafniensis]|uniref:General stress protein 17M-like domain-containing protein n=1 Tax=Leifsonia kafniensis TaxID=475957 RepID=A0ABP7KBV7_9MICO